MTFDDFLTACTALDALAGFDRDAALAAGVKTATVDEWGIIHRVYFGPTTAPKQRARALERARAGFTLEQLAYVERRIAHVPSAGERMRLRIELLAVPCIFNALKRRAGKIVPLKDPAPPQAQVRFSPSRCGMRTVALTADEHVVAELEHYLRERIDKNRPAAPQMVAPFIELLRGDGTGVPASAPRPLVLVPLDACIRVLGGQGDDTVLGLSDGTTITGAELLPHLGAELELALIHPQEGAVNLYRAARFANQKQRDLARVMMPGCPVPGCRHGADACEIHHIVAWSRGGETNIANLVPLCKYHNGTNDDDPSRLNRGRIEPERGTGKWYSPNGRPASNPIANAGAMELLFG